MGDRWDRIPEDLFMEIHRRVPPCPGRRLRLVCRHWRKAIDDGTPAKPQARAKVLAFVDGLGHPRAYVFDDLTTRSRDLNLRSGAAAYAGATMAGTCNGLLCLRRRHGDVVVANPATGEKLAVPPPSTTAPEAVCNDAAAYGFGYDPATGLYKVVHLPCDGDGDGDGGTFDAVNVFTLGDRSWRRVPVPAGSSCRLSLGIVVTVDGAAYWVSKDDDAPSLMAFDLKDEHLVFVTALPERVRTQLDRDSSSTTHLATDGRGRLGLAVCCEEFKRSRTTQKGDKTEVWMLEDGGSNDTKPTWVLRYAVSSPEREAPQEIAWPLVADGGQHILSTRAWAGMGKMSWVSLHAYSLSEAREHGGVALLEWEKKKPFIGQYGTSSSLLTFAYVETREPLALYGHGGDVISGDGEWSWEFNGLEGRWKLTRRLSSAWHGFR